MSLIHLERKEQAQWGLHRRKQTECRDFCKRGGWHQPDPSWSLWGDFPAGTDYILSLFCCCALLFPTPWNAACQASLSFTIAHSLLKLMSIESLMSSNNLRKYNPSLFPLKKKDVWQHPTACGTLFLQPGIEPTPPALEGRVLTTGPLGKSLDVLLLNRIAEGSWTWHCSQTLLPWGIGMLVVMEMRRGDPGLTWILL